MEQQLKGAQGQWPQTCSWVLVQQNTLQLPYYKSN